MELIATDTDPALARMLDSFEHPAILVTPEYLILATNDRYRDKFGLIDAQSEPPTCYRISHGYDRPCDQAGESCPLAAARTSGQRERVLHIHQTPRGQEHVDVEMLPILNGAGELAFFVELLKPVPLAGIHDRNIEMQGASPAFNTMLESIARVGPTGAAVLLQGESGTGKELAAHAIHQSSARASKPMVTLECAGLNEMVFESELFGHVKGAFTGANYRREGLAGAAHGGTLFLDEVGDIPLALQVKLLRLIETGTYRPVGSTQVHHADFRLVTATHRNLEAMVDAGEFRQDLFYRINVFPIYVPSLQERLADLPMLANNFLRQPDAEPFYLTESAITRLKQHRYRGNIRELRNLLLRAKVLTNTNVIDRACIERSLSLSAEQASPTVTDRLPDDLSLDAAARQHLQHLLTHFAGDKERAAAAAGISVRSLYRRLSTADE